MLSFFVLIQLSTAPPSEMKERDGPLEIDSSPPDSPSSASSMTDSKDSETLVKEPVPIRKNKVRLRGGDIHR